jgi:hypothetical protein
MKQVLFSMDIPKWAKWKTTDNYGYVWVWECKPIIVSDSTGWKYWTRSVHNSNSNFECIMQLMVTPKCIKDTLVKIQW